MASAFRLGRNEDGQAPEAIPAALAESIAALCVRQTGRDAPIILTTRLRRRYHVLRADRAGQIVILNGTPRSGESSIATAIRNSFEGVWMNLGVDRFKPMAPDRYQRGIGLRPGGERPDLEPLVALLYRAMYESIAAHSRLRLNVVVDVGHHDAWSVPLGILPMRARIPRGLPVLFVGVRCPIEVVMDRRRATWGVGNDDREAAPKPVMRWQQAVHEPGIYDLEVDTSALSPEECVESIRRRLACGPPPSAFERIAAIGQA